MHQKFKPWDDGDDEIAPHEAEDEGAGEEEVEDRDPHPEDDQHRRVGVHADYHGICGVVVDGGGGDLLAMSMLVTKVYVSEALWWASTKKYTDQ